MNIAKYSIFIEYLRFGLKHKEEGLRWTKMTYLSLALVSPKGRFVKKGVQQYHKNYIVKYASAKARREGRRKRRGRLLYKFGGWRNRRGAKVRIGKRSSVVAELVNYRPVRAPLGRPSEPKTSRFRRSRSGLRLAMRKTILKTIASKIKVTFYSPAGSQKVARINRKSPAQQVKLTLGGKFYRSVLGDRTPKTPTASSRIGNFILPHLSNNCKNQNNNLRRLGVGAEGQVKYRQAGYRIAKRVRSVRKSANRKYSQLLESRKKFSKQELDNMQNISLGGSLVGAKFLFFFYGGLYPGAFRKLRRSFTGKNVLKLKHFVWF